MNVLTNALLLNGSFSGMQYSTENLLEAIKEINSSDTKIEVLLSKDYHGKLSTKGSFKVRKLSFSTLNRLNRILYENCGLMNYFNKGASDLYHSTSNMLPYFTRVPSILTVHDLVPVDFPEYASFETKVYYKLFLSNSIRKASRIIAVSHTVKEAIISRYKINPDKIHVVYHGVEPCFKRVLCADTLKSICRKYKLPDSFLLFVGNLEPKKNLVRLIEAYIHLKKHFRIKQKLVIAGKNGWKYETIYNKVKLEKLESEIIFTGYVEREDLPSLYTLCDLFTFPSVYEGFGLPVLEAMACEAPVLISKQGSLPEITDNIEPRADAFDIQDIASKMYSLLTNDEMRAKNIHHGINRVKYFTWKKTAQETLEVYKKIMDRA